MNHSNTTKTTDLVKSLCIENMINQRAVVLERLDQAVKLISEARELAIAAHLGFTVLKFSDVVFAYQNNDESLSRRRADELANMRREIDRPAWGYLMNESGLRSLMDAKARGDWDEQVKKGDIPDLTMDNVNATFAMLYTA
jgi:Domain of unknown function (DUF4942)